MLLRGGEPVALTPKVFETLVYLVEHRGKVLSKDELMSAIWPDTVVEENNLGQNISRLRAVLGERPSEHRFIATVPGRGYRFVADVTLLASGGVIESAVPELPESESLQEDVVPADPLLPLTPAGRTRRRVWGVA
ncbi:MAG: transcriptional regulator, partial [Blastocatellia bacterium]